ncbi:MAG: hypothetical protein IT328_00375 [Caldilineaceae bacterium]|nr:hypothetical protein [Caldilineaceae bacterium]
MKRFWIWQRYATPTHQIGSYTITPVMRSVGLRWPNGGWLWQFPLAVEVAEEDGTQQQLPIADPTRSAVWFLYTLLLLFAVATLFALWSSRKRKRQGKKKG